MGIDGNIEQCGPQTLEILRPSLVSRHPAGRGSAAHPHPHELASQAAVYEAIGHAEHEILCMLTEDPMSAEHTLQLLQSAHRRGVQIRSVVPIPLSATSAALRELRDHPGFRSREVPDQTLVIVDRHEVAVGPRGGAEAAPQTRLTSDHPLADTLRTMFDVIWGSGVPLAEVQDLIDKVNSEPARSILSSLSAGEKDEVAARKLCVSVRTYRRHVAGIMRDMNAESRFQAGVRAAELGLVL